MAPPTIDYRGRLERAEKEMLQLLRRTPPKYLTETQIEIVFLLTFPEKDTRDAILNHFATGGE